MIDDGDEFDECFTDSSRSDRKEHLNNDERYKKVEEAFHTSPPFFLLLMTFGSRFRSGHASILQFLDLSRVKGVGMMIALNFKMVIVRLSACPL